MFSCASFLATSTSSVCHLFHTRPAYTKCSNLSSSNSDSFRHILNDRKIKYIWQELNGAIVGWFAPLSLMSSITAVDKGGDPVWLRGC